MSQYDCLKYGLERFWEDPDRPRAHSMLAMVMNEERQASDNTIPIPLGDKVHRLVAACDVRDLAVRTANEALRNTVEGLHLPKEPRD